LAPAAFVHSSQLMEAAMFIEMEGPFSGEYITKRRMWIFWLVIIYTSGSSWNLKGTLTLVSLKHIYSKFGAPIQTYPHYGKLQVLFLHVSVSFTENLKHPMKCIPHSHCMCQK
jgi:hypothetical protein